MHKYEGIKRFEATPINQTESVKSIEKKEKGGKVKSFFLRSLFALLLVLALFLGKVSGIAEVEKVSESIKSAICYDFFDDESEESEKT